MYEPSETPKESLPPEDLSYLDLVAALGLERAHGILTIMTRINATVGREPGSLDTDTKWVGHDL